MATMILLPDGQNNVSADWIPIPATFPPNTVSNALFDDNGATSYVKCDVSLETMIVEFANPSVVEADIDTIDSVRFLSSGRSTNRTFAARVSIDWEKPTGNTGQTCAYLSSRSAYTTVNGGAKSHADGTSGGWTYANLESLEMKCLKVQTIEVYLSYLALEVTYTPAVSADNATFFGANF